MARKFVKVYLSPETAHILESAAQKTGLSEEEILRHAFIEYAHIRKWLPLGFGR